MLTWFHLCSSNLMTICTLVMYIIFIAQGTFPIFKPNYRFDPVFIILEIIHFLLNNFRAGKLV